MPTNDERREMAAKLRGLAVVALRGSDDVVGFIEALDEELFDFGPNLMSDIALRLAEFIEPEERTCHMECVKSGPFYDVFRFDCCGKEYSESRTDDGATELPLAVCPFCGAKVVHDA